MPAVVDEPLGRLFWFCYFLFEIAYPFLGHLHCARHCVKSCEHFYML